MVSSQMWPAFSFRADSASAAWKEKFARPRFARENKVPYLGLCLGMQVATIEFARNVCGIAAANSSGVRSGIGRAGYLPAR